MSYQEKMITKTPSRLRPVIRIKWVDGVSPSNGPGGPGKTLIPTRGLLR